MPNLGIPCGILRGFSLAELTHYLAKCAHSLLQRLAPWEAAAQPDEVIVFRGGRAHDARQNRYPVTLGFAVDLEVRRIETARIVRRSHL